MMKSLNGAPFLEGQPNFRGFEEMVTIDGRKIRANLVYRSGSLHKLSQKDIRKLEEIGLSSVIDFRSDREVAFQPTVPVSTVIENHRIVIPDSARDLALKMLDDNDLAGMNQILIQDYRRMILHDSGSFAAFFRTLETAGKHPLVFHCAAGKDRTGLASVLFLTAMGVDEAGIRKDYMESNERLKSYVEKIILKVSEEGKNGEILRPMMEVRPEYLNSALDTIVEQFGGMQHYLKAGLGVNTDLLKAKYLE